ncbi:tRNA cyclic N6-threonylcarbamoyladenosine(37) synthase TcdA [Teredinibacter haidensis]|uniref:tRNA cyclic N6-threonylcarbamoyladenosine(37) synthase TcdA n=1 Tax=Teredinibacter haidensis TaxID=2731755 RepID=UPI000948C0B1|nr:tRNA cyclic N6-threonylcarbamoyladenosine(37) synthase TcdA [Teredinibacter haidensis]
MTAELSPDYIARFAGIGRLYGTDAMAALAKAHFAVIGLGGVGTWAAEALARSGVGELTLIELDDVCVTNTNRQIHALKPHIGQSKNQVMADRLKAINPEITLRVVHDFLTQTNLEQYIGEQHHVIIDAIDSVHVKAALAAYCSRQKIRLVTCGSSGGKLNPARIMVDDLGCTKCDPLLAKMRNLLYHKHNFARSKNRRFRIDAVYSDEQMVYPKADGSVCSSKQYLQDGVKLDCAGGFGSSVMVTGSFGFNAATKAIERYLARG